MATESEGLPDLNPMILARYLSGEADRDECMRVERWIVASPEHRALVETMRAAWKRPPLPEFDPDNVVWRRIQHQIAAPSARPVVMTDRAPARWRVPFGHRGRRSWVAAAAAILVVVAGAALATRSTLSRHSAMPSNSAVSQRFREIATRRGERLTLRLGDGTRAVIGPETRLRLAGGFDREARGPREVHLDQGEVFFEVVHDGARPFRVHTRSAMAEDLGTKFVVVSYPEDAGTKLVVSEGVVALRPAGASTAAPLTLRAGDLGTVDTAGGASLVRDVDLRPYVAWVDGMLVFDGTPLAEVIADLRRWYDVDVRLAEPALARKKLTATFRDEPVAEVLQLVAMSLDLVVVDGPGETVLLRAAGGRGVSR